MQNPWIESRQTYGMQYIVNTAKKLNIKHQPQSISNDISIQSLKLLETASTLQTNFNQVIINLIKFIVKFSYLISKIY